MTGQSRGGFPAGRTRTPLPGLGTQWRYQAGRVALATQFWPTWHLVLLLLHQAQALWNLSNPGP